MTELQSEALKRIYAAAAGILCGEENPREAAEDIQKMVINGLKGEALYEWTHEPYDVEADVL